MSEIEALKKENTEIMRQFRHLLSKSKYLLTIVNNFKRENEQLINLINIIRKENEELREDNERLKKDNQLLRLELLNLQNHCKDLAHEIAIQCNHSKSALNHREDKFLDYLLKRNKTGIRPRSLNKHMKEKRPKVRMISSLPKSGTWANQYFWAVLDSLCKNADTFDPYDPFFMRLDGIGVDLFIVTHIHCPRYRDYGSEDILRKLDAIKYPCARDFDWGTKYLRENGLDKVYDPFLNEDVKIVFMYRNPLDQVVSYARGVWDDKMPQRGPLRDFVYDREGNYIQINNIKQYVRTGGIASYIYYFVTYLIMKDVLGSRLMFVRYEDIFRNRYEKYKEIAEFLLESAYDNNIEFKLKEALEITKIENMKLLEKATGRAIIHHYSSPAGKTHVRDGSIGRWKNVLDQEDVDYIFNLLDEFSINRDYFVFE